MSTGTLSEHQDYDAQLIAIKTNDDRVLQQLYQENYSKAEKFIIQNSGSSDDAKDIFQEAFIVVWRNVQLEKFIPQNASSIDAYLFQIVRNKWMDYLRSAKYKKTIPLIDQYDNINIEELTTEDAQHINNIKEKFKQLGENCRDLLTRFYYRKESLKKIAAELEWTESTAKNNKYRCMEKLRRLLKN